MQFLIYLSNNTCKIVSENVCINDEENAKVFYLDNRWTNEKKTQAVKFSEVEKFKKNHVLV